MWLLRTPRNGSRGWGRRLLPTRLLTAARGHSHCHSHALRASAEAPSPGAAVPGGRWGRHTRGGAARTPVLRTFLCLAFPLLLSLEALPSRPDPGLRREAARLSGERVGDDRPASPPRTRATLLPARVCRSCSPPHEGRSLPRQRQAWRVAGSLAFTVSLASCAHMSAPPRAPEGAWRRQPPGWERHRLGDLWGGSWTYKLRRLLSVSIYLSLPQRAETRVGSGTRWGPHF